MNIPMEEYLMHYGMPRRSGRYPWGSGKDPYQHAGDFLSRIEALQKQGLKEKEIADAIGLSTTQLRVQKTLANNERRADLVATAKRLRYKEGLTLQEIASQMGFKNDSSVRSLLNEKTEERKNTAQKTADILKKVIDEKGMVDVGAGVELELGVSQNKLNEALEILAREGYPTYGGRVSQATNPGKKTTLKVVCPPGTEHKEIYDSARVHSFADYISYDGGDSFRKAFEYPASMDSSRIKIRYEDEGGKNMDGVMLIRRGVKDLSLGNSHYAQVRILVDGTHYLKGMAMYSDDLPDGTDILFNTNKKAGTPLKDVLKPIKDDPANPFGALIKEHGGQSYYDDPNGKFTDPLTGKKQSLSLINKTREEGDWGEWADKIPTQFLAKQNISLAKRQLDLTLADRKAEFEEICSYNNPTVKKRLLQSFSDDCDAAAVHLKAAALPRQKFQVILPVDSLKDTEIYAPNYRDGEKVALVRYPHGGRFEIPILTVNNKQADAKKTLGNALDAVGINHKVANILSGADFDGDTVMVIPCNSPGNKIHIENDLPLKDLKDFDPKEKYGGKEPGTFKEMKESQKQREMGSVSNLITDMTLKGATPQELARAVRHSMVVIDAVKHHLDYKQSEEDNGIPALKKKYQGRIDEDGRYHEGASTLISRAKGEKTIPKRQGSPRINPDTGELIWKTVDDPEWIDKNGKVHKRTQKSTQMAETKDAHTLSTGHPMEELYADYANAMKAMANDARKEMVHTGKIKYSAAAKETYKSEVSSLNSKLNVALKNAPRERLAQLITDANVEAKKKQYDLSEKEIKKIGQQELTAARIAVGAKRHPIEITDREWEAIQAGAISENQLKSILDHANIDEVRKRATPRSTNELSSAKRSRIASMSASGYTIAQIADALGISRSTVSKELKK